MWTRGRRRFAIPDSGHGLSENVGPAARHSRAPREFCAGGATLLPVTADRGEYDKRVARTHRAVFAAFHELLFSQRYEAIRVADIIERSAVGRSTFYDHFRAKDDVLRRSVVPVLAMVADAAFRDVDPERTRWVLEHFWERRHHARPLLRGDAARQMSRVLTDEIAQRLQQRAVREGRRLCLPIAWAAAQLAEGQLALIRSWLASDGQPGAFEVAAALRATSQAAADQLWA